MSEESIPEQEAPATVPTSTDPVAIAHARGNRVTIVPPDEVVALSDLTGKPVSDIIAAIIKRECSVIRARALTLVEA